MLSDESRRTIDALSREALVHEIHLGNRSRFQGEKYAYLKTRLALLEQQPAEKPVSLKQRLESHPLWYVGGLMITAFLSGFAFHNFFFGSTNSAKSEWSTEAKKADWIPKAECPAYPVSVRITSPGPGSSISFAYGNETLSADLVVQVTRSIPQATSLGVIFNEEGSNNYYLKFPKFSENDSRTVFRDDGTFKLPFSTKSGATLNLWAVIVDEKRKFGNVYSSLDQIRASGADVTVSPKVILSIN